MYQLDVMSHTDSVAPDQPHTRAARSEVTHSVESQKKHIVVSDIAIMYMYSYLSQKSHVTLHDNTDCVAQDQHHIRVARSGATHSVQKANI